MDLSPREPVPVSEVVERALYDPEHGFYETGGRAGRRGDFLTSPEVGPLFGALLARAVDTWWDELGRPAPYVVHESGAGPGSLARAVVAARPRCAPALRWVLVERSAAQRRLHADHLPHLGDVDAVASATWGAPVGGPLVASSAVPPSGRPHLAVANELLDNLPFDLAERRADGWDEVRVVVASGEEVRVPLDGPRAALLDRLAPGSVPGARAPLQDRAASWVAATVSGLAPGGRLLVVDYGASTPELVARPWTTWVRTYRGQQRGASPFAALGTQDVTVEVAIDQLAEAVGPPTRDRSQAEALRDWGLDELVAEARAATAALAGPGALEAIRVRSRVREAEALTEPGGLGSFRVLEWVAPTGAGAARGGEGQVSAHPLESLG